MTAGMFATPQSDGAIDSYDFLAELFDTTGSTSRRRRRRPSLRARRRLRVIGQVEDTRKALDDAGSDAPIWVTEIGWGSDPNVRQRARQDARGAGGAARRELRDALDRARSWGSTGWSGTRGATRPDAVGDCGWCATAGLVDADRDSKPAWLAFTELTGGTP